MQFEQLSQFMGDRSSYFGRALRPPSATMYAIAIPTAASPRACLGSVPVLLLPPARSQHISYTTIRHILIHDIAKAYQLATSIDYGVRSTGACPTCNYPHNADLLVASLQY
jgi:hypothetical protein